MAVSTGTALGVRAKGTFGPSAAEAIDQIALTALRGDQFIVSAKQSVIGGCGDERVDSHGARLPLPPVFGGLFSAVLADALTVRLWYRPGMTMQEHAFAVSDALRQIQPAAQLCVHTDEHSLNEEECGCAAIAKAAVVVGMMVEPDYEDLINIQFRDEIVKNAHELLDGGYFQSGTAHFVDELERRGVKKEVLAGSHTAVAVLVNDDEATLYDRPAFYAWCRAEGLPVTTFFEYSRWAMRRTSRLLAPTREELFFAAADAFNMAVPYAICNPDTLVLERRQSTAN